MILKAPKQRSTEATDEKDLMQMILEGAKNYDDNPFSGYSRDSFDKDFTTYKSRDKNTLNTWKSTKLS